MRNFLAGPATPGEMIRRSPFALLPLAFVAACGRSPAPGAPPSAETSTVPAASPSAAGPLRSVKELGVEAQLVAFPSGALTLHGWLWRPPGDGPFPAIVYSHGSEEYPGPMPGQAEFFVPRGFTLFVPHRRGQGRSKDAGKYIVDTFERGAALSPVLADGLSEQANDVAAAVEYVRGLDYVDKGKVALAGCSFGGIESLLGAERSDGIVAAVDFAGASAMWKQNIPLQDRMKTAARNARVPVLFLQAENDFDTTPSLTLSAIMRDAGKRASVHIYPAFGVTHEEGHGFCGGGANPPWGDEVLAFLGEAMKGR
jgi:dienelactone hydrolase